MNVLIVTGIFPPDIGGPASYVPRMAAALVARGHAVVVVTLSDRLDHDDRTYPFRVVRVRRGGSPLQRLPRVLRALVQHGGGADVLFSNTLGLEAALANLWLRKPHVQKVVGDLAWERATAQGRTTQSIDAFQHTPHPWRVELTRRLRTWWTRAPDAIVTPSRYLAAMVEGWGVPPARIHVVYNAVHLPTEVDPAALPLPTRRHVIAVNRLVVHKHTDRLVSALATLPDDVGLVVVGEGPERSTLEAQAETLGVAHRVHFAGQQPPGEVARLLRACEVYALVSSYEGLPHTVLEARALGCVVAATGLPGTREAVGDGDRHVLIEAPTPEAVHAALETALQHAAREGRRPEHDARFDATAMVEGTEAVLRHTAARP